MKNILFKSISALLFIGVSTATLADTSYIACYHDKNSWEWGLDDSGQYQKIAGTWEKDQYLKTTQFHLVDSWSEARVKNICTQTLKQKRINAKVTKVYAATSTFGSNYEIVYPTIKPAPKPATTRTLTKLGGQWERIKGCIGENCDGLKVTYTEGVEKGNEIAKGSSLGMSISATLGIEGGVPGVGTAKAEFTSALSAEQTTSIMNSFTKSSSHSTEASCKGASEVWQWVSVATVRNGTNNETIKANSDLIACAPIGKGPKGTDLNNPTWSP